MKVVPLRLHGAQQEQAGCVISAVGSLSLAQLRLAGATEATTIHGELEILSLSGTLSPDGAHLHITVADRRGAVISLLPDWQFRRVLDPATAYAELRISPRDPS